MAKVRDLVDEVTRSRLDYWEAVEAGDPSTVADAMDRLGMRRHDAVGTWPSDRLDELAAARPDLLPEIIRRRGSEVQQL